MKKGRELKNKPVFDIVHGKLLGYVKELRMADDHKLAGLYVATPQADVLYIALENISNIGRDAVLVKGSLEEIQGLAGLEEDWTAFNGSSVMTASGKSLGMVEDIIIEEDDGRITGYEISDGLLKDMFVGRRIIPASSILTSRGDTVIVADTNLE